MIVVNFTFIQNSKLANISKYPEQFLHYLKLLNYQTFWEILELFMTLILYFLIFIIKNIKYNKNKFLFIPKAKQMTVIFGGKFYI